MRCIVCGNEIKDNSLECPICGSKQLGTPIYNTQQFTDLQHQINNMHINNNQQVENNNLNNNYYGPNQPQPMVQQPMMQQPVQQYVQQPTYSQPVGYINPIQNGYPYKPNPTKGKDIASVVLSAFGAYYSLCVYAVISKGLNEFISENLSDPKYAEVLESKAALTGCITWPLFLLPIISLILVLSARKTAKTKLNTIGLVASIIILGIGVISSCYIYNNL